MRHADAGDRGAWRGDDRDRPLSARGRAQAGALLAALEPTGVRAARAVLSSDSARCVETVAPLAGALGLRVEAEPSLREGTPPHLALALVARAGGAVLCSHGDVIGDLVTHLHARGVVAGGARWPKASTWVLEVEEGEVVAGRLVPPPRG